MLYRGNLPADRYYTSDLHYEPHPATTTSTATEATSIRPTRRQGAPCMPVLSISRAGYPGGLKHYPKLRLTTRSSGQVTEHPRCERSLLRSSALSQATSEWPTHGGAARRVRVSEAYEPPRKKHSNPRSARRPYTPTVTVQTRKPRHLEVL